MRVAVIPIKLLTQTKTRLSNCCTPRQRAALCLDMLKKELKTLLRCRELDSIFITTPDPHVMQYINTYFPEVSVLFDQDSHTLNAAVNYAKGYFAEAGFRSMLFLQGDLPLISTQDIAQAVALSRESNVVLMPDRHGTGTNGMLVSPPDLLTASFGTNSFLRHHNQAQQLGIVPKILRTPGFSTDIDTENDLIQLNLIRNGKSTYTYSSLGIHY